MLLAGLLAPPSEAQSALLKIVPAMTHYWNSSHPHDTAVGGSGAYDATALFVLFNCRVWPLLSSSMAASVQGEFEGAMKALRSRLTQDGLYAIPHPLAGGGASIARASHQAQAIAALRCASATLQQPQLAVHAAMLLRQLHAMYLPPPTIKSTADVDDVTQLPFMLAALVTPKASGRNSSSSNGSGGSLQYALLSQLSAFSSSTNNPLSAELGLHPSELAQLLLWLEPGDLPDTVIARVAAFLQATLETPAGWRDGVASVSGSGSWRVSPMEQTVTLLGATKHIEAAVPKARQAAIDGTLVALWRGGRRAQLQRHQPVTDENGEVIVDYGDSSEGANDGSGGDPEAWQDGENGANGFGDEEDEDDYYAPMQEAPDMGPSLPQLIRPETSALIALLRSLIETTSRIAPLLEQCEKEAAARGLARDLAAVVAQALPTPSPGDVAAAAARQAYMPAPPVAPQLTGLVQRQAAAGGASARQLQPQQDTLALVAGAAHRFTFPEFFTPLSASETPLDPSLAAPIIPAWTLLKDAALSRLLHSKVGEYAVKVVAGARNGSGVTVLSEKQPSGALQQQRSKGGMKGMVAAAGNRSAALGRAIGGRAQAAVGKLIQLVYPQRGLRVVRMQPTLLPTAAGSDPAAAAAAPLAVEHVVVEVSLPLYHAPPSTASDVYKEGKAEMSVDPVDALLDASADADGALRGGSNKKAQAALALAAGKQPKAQLRGDGHPLSLATVAASRLFRAVSEQAKALTARRLAAAQVDQYARPRSGGSGFRGAGLAQLARLARYGTKQKVVRPALDDILLVLLDDMSAAPTVGMNTSLAQSFTWLSPEARDTASQELDRQRQRLSGGAAAAGGRNPQPAAGGVDSADAAAVVAGAYGSPQPVGAGGMPLPVPGLIRPGPPDPEDVIPAPQRKAGADAEVPFQYPDVAGGDDESGDVSGGGNGAGVEGDAMDFIPVPNARPAPPPQQQEGDAEEGSDAAPIRPPGAPVPPFRPPEPPPAYDPAQPPPGIVAAAAAAPAEVKKVDSAAKDGSAAAAGDIKHLQVTPLPAATAPAPVAAAPTAPPAVQQPAPAAAAPARAVVNIVDVFARVCPTNDDGSAASVPYAQPWAAACCGDVMSSLVLQHADDSGIVPVADLPTFTCKVRTSGGGLQTQQQLPCSYVRDDHCDCADGEDEPTSAACAREGAAFFCASGVRVVDAGALVPLAKAAAAAAKPVQVDPAQLACCPVAEWAGLGYIPASKVSDGVKDCVEGEDEAA